MISHWVKQRSPWQSALYRSVMLEFSFLVFRITSIHLFEYGCALTLLIYSIKSFQRSMFVLFKKTFFFFFNYSYNSNIIISSSSPYLLFYWPTSYPSFLLLEFSSLFHLSHKGALLYCWPSSLASEPFLGLSHSFEGESAGATCSFQDSVALKWNNSFFFNLYSFPSG